MKTLSKLIEERDEVVARARALLDSMESPTPVNPQEAKLFAEHDQLMARFDELQPQIDRMAKLSNAEARSAECSAFIREREGGHNGDRPDMGGNGFALGADTGRSAWNGGTGWADSAGNPVRVLSNREKLGGVERAGDIALGDVLRAKLTGPRNEAEERALSEGTNTAGGYTVPSLLASFFIDRLRRQSVFMRAGAMTVPMTSKTLTIARLDTDPTVGWRAENAALATGDPTFSAVTLTAKSLACMVKTSRELLADSVNIGAILENALLRAMAVEFDRAIGWGSGSSDEPLGVTNISGINSVSMGTNGAALASYAKLIDTVYEMQLDNAADPTAQIMHPRTNASLSKLVDSTGNPLVAPDMIARIPRLTTTAAPINETQGSASTASSILYGDFTQMLVGIREEISIEMLPQPFAANGQIAFIAHMRGDVALAHNESFAALKGITG